MLNHLQETAAMRKHIIRAIIGIGLLSSQPALDAKPLPAAKQDTAIARFSVSLQQEKNFNAFMAWLEAHQTLAQDDSLKQAYRSVFAAMKKNNAREYSAQLKWLDQALAKISHQAKKEMTMFFSTLPPVKSSSSASRVGLSEGGGGCSADCIFGSCEIECPAGTKPKCQCHSGEPDSGCEPYGVQ